ncbi:MAG: HEPN domain-containing protein [Candidatus Methanodesulfokora sp.]|jgi:uncharacterized protein (UPF0332 family)
MREYEVHVRRALAAYRAFKILRAEGLMEDAASRGYYAILHLCNALLLKHGEDLPRTHSGLIAKLWILREKLSLDKETVSDIARAQSIRERGDYGVVPTITEDDLDFMENLILRLRGKLDERE